MYRTDLAIEAHQQHLQQDAALQGVEVAQTQKEQILMTEVTITTPDAAEQLEKPMGRYITLELESLVQRSVSIPEPAARMLGEQLLRLVPDGPVLVVGLGNAAVTPDAVGPRTLEHLLVTRHLRQFMPDTFGDLRACCAFAPGVLGATGMESAGMVRSVAALSGAASLIVVDALAACEEKRLCTTVQLADTGIIPGSGIGNSRAAFNRQTMGVPVIAVGVPTVIRAEVLRQEKKPGDLIVTPSDIDQRVAALAKMIGMGINRALFPELKPEELAELTMR